MAADETIWLTGENGALLTVSRTSLTPHMARRIKAGLLRRVHPDGTPWEGDPLPPAPLPLPPQLIIATLRGYRYWQARDDGQLVSHGIFKWPDGGQWAEATCAECARIGREIPSQEPCQDYGYGCGLYAASTPERGIMTATWGVVEAKGRIVSHKLGFRARYARPVALARTDSHHSENDAAAAARYGIPLLAPEALAGEYPPDIG